MMVIFGIINLLRLLFFFILSLFLFPFFRNKSIYFFLKLSGPTFIKLGQLLSNRPDLVGDDLAEILSGFQDRLPGFSFKKAKKIIEEESGKKLDQLFLEFKAKPVASASVAQVHKAKTFAGDIVAVKILRPHIATIVRRDVSTLKIIAFLFGFVSKYSKEKFLNIAELLEDCSKKELDLSFEAAAASEMKDKLKDVKGFYIPKVYWQLSTPKILVLEWIDGIPFSDKKAILSSGFDRKEIAKNLVISYFNQVYVHGLFHADMHLGNLFLMKNGDIAAVDFGITGSIDKKTRIAIAEILMSFLKQDYARVAKLHIDAGLVPKNINLEEFTLSCRIIGESVVGRSVNEISMAKLLANLLKMTKRYQLKTRPELLLLQKTMMLVEGVGVFLDKNLNIWDLAKPFVKEWATQNIGFDAKIRDVVLEFMQMVKKMPENFSKNNQMNFDQLNQEIKEMKLREKKWKIAFVFLSALLILSLFIRG
ncbi:MAG: ubiB [Rickettsiaceae bacterium]|jgi:ubiquinone biosynthesis protein|nr:ubiB [Rickettsiaceae bacterium]